MFVQVGDSYLKLYERKDGSKFYNRDGKRITLRKNQKTVTSKGSPSRKAKPSKKKASKKKSKKINWKAEMDKEIQKYRKKKLLTTPGC